MAAAYGAFRLHDGFRFEIVHIGRERQPVIVVDNFLDDAQALVGFAASRLTFRPMQTFLYPGVRAAAPQTYAVAILSYLGKLIADTFAFKTDGAVTVDVESDFSLVTLRPEQSRLHQRIPHADGFEPNIIAVLHYLCGHEHGGTSFYRHRQTGFETMSRPRFETFDAALKAELEVSPPSHYMNGDSDLFERVASFECAFNRALIYRGMTLHSGDIARDFHFSPDPRTGRLTINSLLRVR